MPRQQKQGRGAGTRKFGRYERKPSNLRYRSETRWAKNKAKRIYKKMIAQPKYKPFNISVETETALNKLLQRRSV